MSKNTLWISFKNQQDVMGAFFQKFSKSRCRSMNKKSTNELSFDKTSSFSVVALDAHFCNLHFMCTPVFRDTHMALT